MCIEAEVRLGLHLFDSNYSHSFIIGCLSGGVHESDCGFNDRVRKLAPKGKR